MTNNYEAGEHEVQVRDRDGRFQPVPTPHGFNTLAFRNALAAYDTAYRVQGRLPTVDQVHGVWPKVPKKTYAALFMTDEFQQALRYRGIEWDVDAGLSMEQSMAITKLSDPFDRRSISVKLKELGIPMPRYQAWLKNPLFYEARNQTLMAAYREALPDLRNRLISEAEAGKMQALEMIFAITGEWDPNQKQLEDAKVVLTALVEAVISKVHDPKVREEIWADVRGHAVTMSVINQSKALEA